MAGSRGDVSDETLYQAIGVAVRKARIAAGLSQDDLAKAVQMTRTSITNLESGRQQVPLHTLYVVARELGRKIGDFLPDELPGATAVDDLIDDEDVCRWTSLLRQPGEKLP
jgi:transcriptional regulator with XRE-family HTH domain